MSTSTHGAAYYAATFDATTGTATHERTLTLSEALRPVADGAHVWMTDKHPEFGYEVSIHTHRASWHGCGETPEAALRAAIEAYDRGEDAAFARYK